MTKGGVAFFDSGIGGLSVLYACVMAGYDGVCYYYGDNARAPYGNLPTDRIRAYVDEAFELFSYLRVKAVVVACNTVTAVYLDELRKKYPFPIIGTEPALLPAAKQGGEILLLATRATVESDRLQRLMDKTWKVYPSAKIRVVACDGLAGGIEKGAPFSELKKLLPTCAPSAVVLGCTHYIYIKEEIENYYNVPVYDGNEGIAMRLKQVLSTTEKDKFFEKIEKSRDERPLFKNEAKKPAFSHDYCRAEKWAKTTSINSNKCLQKWGKNGQKVAKTLDFSQIFFFGSGREINYKKCEQMFVVDEKSDWRKVDGKI